jgi:hypothetical protein
LLPGEFLCSNDSQEIVKKMVFYKKLQKKVLIPGNFTKKLKEVVLAWASLL